MQFIEGQQPQEPKERPKRPPFLQIAMKRFPAVSILLALNLLLFIINNILGNPENRGIFPAHAAEFFTFSPANGFVFPGVITHMFSHADFGHILGNMLMLFFFGAPVEVKYGTRWFLVIYFAAGIIAAEAQFLVSPEAALLGASGAVAGIMAIFTRHWPNEKVLVYFIIPMPVWLLTVLWVGYNILGTGMHWSGVAFMAHLAGLLVGIVLSFFVFPPRKKRKRKKVIKHPIVIEYKQDETQEPHQRL